MTAPSSEDRVAILLNMLGSELAESVLANLSPEQMDRVRRRQQQLAESPLVEEKVDEVLTDFDRFMRFAKRSSGTLPRIAAGSIPDAKSSGGRPSKQPNLPNRVKAPHFAPFETSDDPIDDLNCLESFQIAGALREEDPRTTALVLNCLNAEMAAETLEQLPVEVRSDVFLQLYGKTKGSPDLLQRVVRATVAKGWKLDRETLTDDESESDQRMADMLRAMSKSDRATLLDALTENDAETASRIKERLYAFEDLLIIDDRSLQKLLTEIDSPTLATALKDADGKLIKKVMSNLSQRARESLAEEMEYLGTDVAEKREGAQKQIVDLIARLDESGELVMIE